MEVQKEAKAIGAKIKYALALGVSQFQFKKMEADYQENNKVSLKMNKAQRMRGKMILGMNYKTLQNQFESSI